MSGIHYSIVVPVYNSVDSIVELCRRLVKVFEETLKESFEIILVDDASPDPGTWKTLENLYEKDSRIRIFQLMQNSGQHNATMCGLNYASGDFVIVMDDDLQHPPEEIYKLIETMGNPARYDAVLAVPDCRRHAAIRNIGSSVINRVVGAAIKKPRSIILSSFRLITRDLKEALLNYTGHMVTVGSLICQITQNIANVEVKHDYRLYGKSQYSLSKLISLAMSNIFNFSLLPLKIIGVVGFVSFLFAIVYASWVIFRHLAGLPTLPGFSSIVVMLSLYCGLILLSFSILGQYIIRILRSVTGGRQFVVRRRRDCLE